MVGHWQEGRKGGGGSSVWLLSVGTNKQDEAAVWLKVMNHHLHCTRMQTVILSCSEKLEPRGPGVAPPRGKYQK